MAVTAYDQSVLNSAQQAQLAKLTTEWETARANGDQAGMDRARAAGEAIRNNAGYYTDDYGNYAGSYNTVADSIIPDYDDIIEQVHTINQENNAVAQQNAEDSWLFNALEAQKNRDWQEYMSNTAHQREVQDLIRAGLNPVLSAGGNGAAVSSGATASGSQAPVDVSANSVLGNFVTSLISSATAINSANINAKSAENIANLNNAMAYKLAHDFPTSDKVFGEALQKVVDYVVDKKDAISSAKESIFDKIGNFFSDEWNEAQIDNAKALKSKYLEKWEKAQTADGKVNVLKAFKEKTGFELFDERLD